MKITFLGAGEAWGNEPNISFLVDNKILIECGMHTVLQLQKLGIIKNIKVVYLSHLHADHALGLPAFLLCSSEEGRGEEIKIMAPRGIDKYIDDSLRISYNKERKNLNFEIKTIEIKEMEIKIEGYKFLFSKIPHSFPCYSISITKNGKKLVYTGDGQPTNETIKLAKNADLLIAEAYAEGFENHSSIIRAARMAKESNAKLLAMVHIFRKENVEEKLREAIKIFSPIILPKEFDVIWI